jgi:hypothetical protein
VRTKTNTEPIKPMAKIVSRNLIAMVISKAIIASLAFTSRSQSVPYELFTNFLAGTYGLLALMQVDGCISRPSESQFGNGYLDLFRDVSSQRDFSGLRRDSLAP